jgi:hypothetical protein
MKSSTFDTFIINEAETAKTNKYAKLLNWIFDKNKERDAYESDVHYIPHDWKIYNKKQVVDKKDIATPSECYDNALAYSKNTGAPLCIGVFAAKAGIEKDAEWIKKTDFNKSNPYYIMFPHAWNLTNDGKIYDITIDNDLAEYIYIGHEVNAKNFKNGFNDLRSFLSKEMEYKKNK